MTHVQRTGTFVGLLVVCLMLAPSRRVIGDRQLVGRSPDLSLGPAVPADTSFAELCQNDPVAAIARSLRGYRTQVESYSCTLLKRERIAGELRPAETIACDFREAPFSVRMRWLAGKNRAEAILYVAGENDDQLLIIPASATLKSGLRLLGRTYASRALTSTEAKSGARYPANEFGIYHSTARVYENWSRARDRGTLRTIYEGVAPVPELSGRPCHILRRTFVVPEEDGLTHVTLYLDAETLLQVGAVLRAGDDLLATYYFRDLRLNPKFDARHFAAENFQ